MYFFYFGLKCSYQREVLGRDWTFSIGYWFSVCMATQIDCENEQKNWIQFLIHFPERDINYHREKSELQLLTVATFFEIVESIKDFHIIPPSLNPSIKSKELYVSFNKYKIEIFLCGHIWENSVVSHSKRNLFSSYNEIVLLFYVRHK